MRRPPQSLLVVIVVLLIAAALGAYQLTIRKSSSPRQSAAQGWQVKGDALVGQDGRPTQLIGVGRSGTEYECLGGHSVFAGPSSASTVSALTTWDVDVVRLPLNEDCWLGINHVPAATSGYRYRDAVFAYVALLRRAGIGVILDLHWTAPATTVTNGQEPMPDGHATTFWKQAAAQYANLAGVAFELYNEPYGVSWSCWVSGCFVPPGGDYPGYEAVGMQSLVDTVRSTGARNPVIVDGLQKASSFSGWLSHPLHDPVDQLMAGWHIYGPNDCTTSCWNSVLADLGSTPVMVTELGQLNCGVGFVNAAMTWLNQHDISYLAWAWDTWGTCRGPSLIKSYTGSPTAYGRDIQHYFKVRVG